MKKKIIISALFALGVIVVSAFFLSQKPEPKIVVMGNDRVEHGENQYTNLQTQCVNHGKYVFQQFQEGQEGVNVGVETTWQAPEYHFNTRLQSCLLSWQTDSVVRGIKFKEGAVVDIQDVQAIKELLRDVDSHGRWAEYIQQKDVLMRE